jgi:hypothetical protein
MAPVLLSTPPFNPRRPRVPLAGRVPGRPGRADRPGVEALGFAQLAGRTSCRGPVDGGVAAVVALAARDRHVARSGAASLQVRGGELAEPVPAETGVMARVHHGHGQGHQALHGQAVLVDAGVAELV